MEASQSSKRGEDGLLKFKSINRMGKGGIQVTLNIAWLLVLDKLV